MEYLRQQYQSGEWQLCSGESKFSPMKKVGSFSVAVLARASTREFKSCARPSSFASSWSPWPWSPPAWTRPSLTKTLCKVSPGNTVKQSKRAFSAISNLGLERIKKDVTSFITCSQLWQLRWWFHFRPEWGGHPKPARAIWYLHGQEGRAFQVCVTGLLLPWQAIQFTPFTLLENVVRVYVVCAVCVEHIVQTNGAQSTIWVLSLSQLVKKDWWSITTAISHRRWKWLQS